MYKTLATSNSIFLKKLSTSSSSSPPLPILKALSSTTRFLTFSRSVSSLPSLVLGSSSSSSSPPISLRTQSRSTAAVVERFERRMATIATDHGFKYILTSLSKPGGGEFGKFFSLPALNDPRIDKLPYSIRILLESSIRNCDNFHITKNDVEKIIDWEHSSPKQVEIPFKPARVLLQDFTGVPAVVDLASMRDAMNKLGSDPNKINPLVKTIARPFYVPVDLPAVVLINCLHLNYSRTVRSY